MAFYPLVDDFDQLKELVGWLVRTVHSTLKLRESLFLDSGVESVAPPAGLTKQQLIKFQTLSSNGSPLDLRLPSFMRIGRVLNRAAMTFGPNTIAHPKSNQYYFSG
jgi:hypothetical protein